MKITYKLLAVSILSLFLFSCSPPRKATHYAGHTITTKRLDIFVLVEKTHSTDNIDTREYVEKALAAISDSLPLSDDGIRMSLSTFSDSFAMHVPITADKRKLWQGISEITAMKKSHDDGYLYPALDSIEDYIVATKSKAALANTAVPPVLILIISDGSFEDREDALNRARVLDADGLIGITTLVSTSAESANGYLRELSKVESNYFATDYSRFLKQVMGMTKSN